MKPFTLIFGHGRSGTSTLRQIFNCNPGFNMLGEPFNTHAKNWLPTAPNYQEIVKRSGLHRAMAAIRETANGMKHLKYQLSPQANLWMLFQTDYRVVFMWRRNMLQTAVSVALGQITNIWARDDVRDVREAYRNIPPLDIAKLQETMARMGGQMRWYKEALRLWKIPHFEIVYEDFYLAMTEEERLAKLREMFAFTETDTSQCDWDKVVELLRTNKLNAHTYHLIPNYEEIAALGSPEVGFLTVPYP